MKKKNPVWWYHENKAVEHGYLPTMLTLCNYLGLIVTHYSLNSVYCLLLLGKQYLGAHPLFCNCWDILVNIFVNTSFSHFYFHFLAHAKDCSGGDWGYIIGRKSLDLAQGGVKSIQQGWQWIWWWWWWCERLFLTLLFLGFMSIFGRTHSENPPNLQRANQVFHVSSTTVTLVSTICVRECGQADGMADHFRGLVSQ